MQKLASGALAKMRVDLADEVKYTLLLDDEAIVMNDLIGRPLSIEYHGAISCQHCGRKTNKSFSQGYCYPCFKKLPQCDSCIVSPEKCHYAEGTCRDPSWGEEFCFQSHYVYLANSSGVKVGITRGTQIPTRWIDQGAVQALPIMLVTNRRLSGLVETVFKQQVADKTNWRAMLKGQVDDLDLKAIRDQLYTDLAPQLSELESEFGLQSMQRLESAEQVNIRYPVLEYPTKVSTFNLDKVPEVSGTLVGIKGQYLILDTGVINIRKFTSYQVTVSAEV